MSAQAHDASQKLSASVGYPEEYRLLELTPEILTQLEGTEKSTLVIRGREDDVAVLVDSEERTYQLHTAHTSNGLYLVTEGPEGLELRTKLNQTFELHKTQPQIRARVLEVLGWETRGSFSGVELEDQQSPSQSDGEDVEMAVDGDMSVGKSVVRHVTDAILARHVQAGERQLRCVLAEVPAFRHAESGHWRIVEPAYCLELLRLILATQIERDWSLDALDAKEVFLALSSDAGGDALLSEAVEAVLGKFSTPAFDRGPKVYAIDSRRVARFLAEQIFATEGARPWPVTEFLAALQATMPPQLQLDDISDLENWRSKAIPQSLVRDMAYVSTPIDSQQLFTPSGVSAESTLLNPLSRSTLPHEPRARMCRMFEARSRWTAAELQPFFEDLVDVDNALLESGDVQAQTTVKKAVDSWLLKFGRGVKGAGGEVVYSSRLN